MESLKFCNKCKRDLPFSAYARDISKVSKIASHCKECRALHEKNKRKDPSHKEKMKIYKQKPENRKRTKDLALKRMFGITLNDYDKLLKKQNYVCSICKKFEENSKALSVDHCHSTGKIRGLLCSNCNLGLGNLKDNIYFLENAIKYLKENSDV